MDAQISLHGRSSERRRYLLTLYSQLCSQLGGAVGAVSILVIRLMLSSERRKVPLWKGDFHHWSWGKVVLIRPKIGLNILAWLPHLATLYRPFSGWSKSQSRMS